MSAEVLRRAAALMRERAESATPGPWRFTDSEAVYDVWTAGMVVVSADADPIANLQDEWYENDPGEPAPLNDAVHIASWHPAVALAVADLLDVWADNDLLGSPFTLPEEVACITDIARAYLGES